MFQFSYTAEIDEGPAFQKLSGNVLERDWPRAVFATHSEAAWAWVRGLLKWEGVWHCSIALGDGTVEHKRIHCYVNENGSMVRVDLPSEPVGKPSDGACHE